ncbi:MULTISPECIES: hypothetical protein [Bacillus subtilis group]|uniref:hypothetical protein n=1 Tax=Bacillus subtilis group TaxID=653685 RepID=UPI000682FEE2|nr:MULTISPECIES: hypothetical protein [Bacillus subtilis group]MDE1403324.1 hypothetical protein [Bacillus licheniformis]MDQ9095485.1 hypothetical protein [Bacillus licheniformis]MEC0476941.1 hypothetical protein [Bacillus licheniformis]MEC0491094.1 hypothetical protein [Bacillus licheniformis]TWL74908.1 hypothetical protein CHCC15315_1847 [Bacillus licheniformis]
MNPRQAFRIFMRFQLQNSVGEEMALSDAEIDKIILGIEDDQSFYDQLDDILKGHIEDFGVNYGIEL